MMHLPTKCAALIALATIFFTSCIHDQQYALPDQEKLAKEYYQEDARWYLDNIPFFECSDKQIEQVYYYRWKLYKAHIRNVGDNSYVITEFINHVPWDRDPYCKVVTSLVRINFTHEQKQVAISEIECY